MIVGGVHILIGTGRWNLSLRVEKAQEIAATLVITSNKTPPPEWQEKIERVERDLAERQPESFVALPGSPYLGYTGKPLSGVQPPGFGSSGIGSLGFALMILTSPSMLTVIDDITGEPTYESELEREIMTSM